jgi:hypothetical protein
MGNHLRGQRDLLGVELLHHRCGYRQPDTYFEQPEPVPNNQQPISVANDTDTHAVEHHDDAYAHEQYTHAVRR